MTEIIAKTGKNVNIYDNFLKYSCEQAAPVRRLDHQFLPFH
jgi:hypothetical protein